MLLVLPLSQGLHGYYVKSWSMMMSLQGAAPSGRGVTLTAIFFERYGQIHDDGA